MPLDDWSIPGTPWLPALDTHTYSLVINSCHSPGLLWWKWLHSTVSPGSLVHTGEVGFRAVLSLGRDPQGSAVGATLLWWDMHSIVTVVKDMRCLQPAQGQWTQLSAWFWHLPREAGFVGRGVVGERRSGSCYFLQSLLLSLASSCLSWMTFVPAAPKRSHFGEMSQASAWMILLHPSLLSLPPPVHPSSAFFILKGHCLEIQVQEKVITFSVQVCLSKSLQSISGWNTGIIPEVKCY